MRALGLGVLAVLIVAGAAPAGLTDRRHQLTQVSHSLNSALEQERAALAHLRVEDYDGADGLLASSQRTIEGAAKVGDVLTPPPRTATGFPATPLDHLGSRLDDIDADDDAARAAGEAHHAAQAMRIVRGAIAVKEHLISAITTAQKAVCTQLINLRGPIVVNGVPQGVPTLTIDWRCSKPIDSIYLDIPKDTFTSVKATGATDMLKRGNHLLVLDFNGAKSAEVSIQAAPTLTTGEAFEEEIVPIHGDGVYIPEVM